MLKMVNEESIKVCLQETKDSLSEVCIEIDSRKLRETIRNGTAIVSGSALESKGTQVAGCRNRLKNDGKMIEHTRWADL
jgi:hypothetical protein